MLRIITRCRLREQNQKLIALEDLAERYWMQLDDARADSDRRRDEMGAAFRRLAERADHARTLDALRHQLDDVQTAAMTVAAEILDDTLDDATRRQRIAAALSKYGDQLRLTRLPSSLWQHVTGLADTPARTN